jgi:hypothetical protein
MSILALLLSSILAFGALTILWMRVTVRNQAVSKHRRMTSHLDWTAPAPGRRRLSAGKPRRA